MKKNKFFIKNNVKIVIAFILGFIIAGSIGVYAATVINASAVSFSGSTTGLTSTNMQDALDEAYSNAIEEYECSTPGTTSDNGYFCSVYSAKCMFTTAGDTYVGAVSYYIPVTKYNITIMSTLDDISDFVFQSDGKNFIVPTSSVPTSTINKFRDVSTSYHPPITIYHIGNSCRAYGYYWKKL